MNNRINISIFESNCRTVAPRKNGLIDREATVPEMMLIVSYGFENGEIMDEV